MVVDAEKENSFDFNDHEDQAKYDPKAVLVGTEKWKEIGAEIYFYVCGWFYSNPKPYCLHGDTIEGVPEPDCLSCDIIRRSNPLW